MLSPTLKFHHYENHSSNAIYDIIQLAAQVISLKFHADADVSTIKVLPDWIFVNV